MKGNSGNTWKEITDRIPGFIKNDIWRKLTAILLTALIFICYLYTNNESTVIKQNIPVTIQVPSGYDVLSQPRPVTVRLKCLSRFGKKIQDRDIRINVEVSPVEGKDKYEVVLKDYTTSSWGSTVESVIPQTIAVSIDKRITKTIKVEPDLSQISKLPEGYTVSSASPQPSEIAISGPYSMLKGIKSIRTTPVPLDPTVTRSFSYAARLAPPKGNLFSIAPEQVMLSVEISRSYQTRIFRNVPVKLLMPSTVDTRTGAKIVSKGCVDITVTGMKRIIETLSVRDLIPYADVSCIQKEGLFNNVPIRCWSAKEGVVIQSMVPDILSVRIGSHITK